MGGSLLVVQGEVSGVVHLKVLWQLEEVLADWEAARVEGSA